MTKWFYLESHNNSFTFALDDPFPWSLSSSRNYLSLTLNTAWIKSTNADFEARRGIRIIIHANDEFPSDSSSHFLQNIHYTDILLVPQLTLLSDDLKLMSIQRRNCYFDHEKKLELFKYYSKQNCMHECQSFAYAKKCSCVPFYLLSMISFEVFKGSMFESRFYLTFQGKTHAKLCEFSDNQCIATIDLTTTLEKCNCLDRCEVLDFETISVQKPEE